MSEETNIHDLIDQYLKGELGRDELDRFKNRMRTEPDFAREVELHKALVDSISEARKQELKDYLKENANVEYIGNIWSQRWVYASAAIIALFVGLFFILKYTMPEGGLADKQEQTESSDEPAFRAEKENVSDRYRDPNDSIRPQDTAVPPEIKEAPLAVVEDNIEDVQPESMSIREMGEIEETLDAEDIDENEVGKEKLIERKNMSLVVITKNLKTVSAEELKDVSVTSKTNSNVESITSEDEKRGIFKRRRSKEDDTETETDSDVPTNESESYKAVPDYTTSISSMNVEFWQNPINAVGYEFNGKILKLYGVGAGEALEFKSYLGHVYMKRGSSYYQLYPAGDFKKFRKLNEQSLIDVLNQ